jgi:hypothetical protein
LLEPPARIASVSPRRIEQGAARKVALKKPSRERTPVDRGQVYDFWADNQGDSNEFLGEEIPRY